MCAACGNGRLGLKLGLGGARGNRMQHFVFSPAMLLDAIGVAVQYLENRKRLLDLGQLDRHVVGRRKRHHRVETDIILAAERPRVGQRSGRQQMAQVGSLLQLLDEHRQQAIDRRLLHQADEWLEQAERQRIGHILAHLGRRGQTEFSRQAGSDARDYRRLRCG